MARDLKNPLSGSKFDPPKKTKWQKAIDKSGGDASIWNIQYGKNEKKPSNDEVRAYYLASEKKKK
jgi:hypothetical protein